MAEAKKELKVKKTTEKEKQEIEATVIAEATPAAAPQEKKVTTAKAGKRSSKAVKESEEKAAKEAKKVEKTGEDSKEEKKEDKKPVRSKIERAGKKYKEAAKLVDNNKVYSINDALELAAKTSTTKFDSSVELHINLGVDPRQADQNVRGTVTLPEGTGKKIRVAAFVEGEAEKDATNAGAEVVGTDTLIAALDKEQIDFDVLVSTPALMPKLAKYARLLGPKGLMPNPKSGTVTNEIATAVKEAKAGKVEYRVDSTGIIHLAVGKVSFGAGRLSKNAQAVIDAVKAAKPASLKGVYIKSSHVSTTMGPGIKVQL
jgi:ribosomal protein L1